MPASAGDARDSGSISGSGRSSGGGHGNPLQYSCVENSIDREAWWATVHGVKKQDVTECVCVCVHTRTQTHMHFEVIINKSYISLQEQWTLVACLVHGHLYSLIPQLAPFCFFPLLSKHQRVPCIREFVLLYSFFCFIFQIPHITNNM